MARKFKQVDYDQVVQISLRLGDCVPAGHLAQFIVEVIALLDLSAIYARYGLQGAPPYAPEIVLGLLCYGDVQLAADRTVDEGIIAVHLHCRRTASGSRYAGRFPHGVLV